MLGISAADTSATRFTIKKPDIWEPALNIILISAAGCGDLSEIIAAASVFGINSSIVRAVADSGGPLPICRVSTRKEAELVCGRIEAAAGRCEVIDDANLSLNVPPVRIRSVKFTGASLHLEDFNTGRIIELSLDEELTVVTGRLRSSRSELRSRRRKDEKRGETSTFTSDTPVIDIHRVGENIGFRLRPDGFDFSGIGTGLLAEENMRLLNNELARRLGRARFDDRFDKLRSEISEIWPPEASNSSRGIYRTGLGAGFAAGETIENVGQFTRYSRMLSALR